LDDITIGGFTIGVPNFFYRTTNDVIGTFVDSGTTLILTGPVIFDAIQATFENNFGSLGGLSGLFSGTTCVAQSKIDIDQYPNVTFSIEGFDGAYLNLDVPPSAYLMDLGNEYCFGIAQTASLGVVLGDVFMENFYVAFDHDNLQLGFADVNPNACGN